MIKKIYGMPNCYKCEKAKKMYPEAEYIDIRSLDYRVRDELMKICEQFGVKSAPILFDESNNLVQEILF